jgi:hypothetical protein
MKRSLKKNRLHLRTGGRAIEVGDRIMYDTWCGLAVLDRRVGPDSEAQGACLNCRQSQRDFRSRRSAASGHQAEDLKSTAAPLRGPRA